MACEKDYSKAIIYTIRTDDGLYVGSTCNFKDRKWSHNKNIYNEISPHYNYKLYKNIRANDGEYRIEMYKPFPCNSKRELEQEEDKVMLEMNANLNQRRAYVSEEEHKQYYREHQKIYYQEKKEYYKKYREDNKDKIHLKQNEKITCECGCKSARCHISTHRKTKKHLNLMKLLDEKK